MGYFSTKEYTGMNFAGLAEPDTVLRSAKLQSAYAANFDLAAFNKIYWTFKHNYRARYSERKMEKYGFEPYAYGSNLEENLVGVDAYMKNIDSQYHHTVGFKLGIADLHTQMAKYFQSKSEYDYNLKDRRLFIGGTQYVYSHMSYLEDDDPYTPDDKTQIVGHFFAYNSLYPDHRNEVFFDIQFPNIYGKEDTVEITYARSIFDKHYYIYLDFKKNVPAGIYNLDEYEITPITTLQEFGLLAENSDQHRQMLNEFGVTQRDFEETLAETDDDGESAIDNAYMMNSLSILNPYEIEARTYQSSEAQYLPSAFLEWLPSSAFEEPVVEGEEEAPLEEGTDFTAELESSIDTTTVIVTAEDSQRWYDKHFKEQAYLARGLFKTFAYYADAINLDVLNSEKFSLIYIGNSVADIESVNSGSEITNFYSKIIKTGDAWKTSDVDITIEQQRLRMQYGYDISIETKTGRVRPDVKDSRAQGNFHYSGRMHSVLDDDGDRDYWTTDDNEEIGYDVLKIQVQKTADTYQEMTITNYRADYDLGPHGFAVGPGAPGTMNRIPLPYFVLKEVKFREYVTISDHSFNIFIFAYKKVPFDWAGFVIKIVLTVLLCMTGAGCTVAVALWQVAQMILIDIAMSYLLDLVDAEILAILQFAYQAYQMSQGDFSATMSSENYLKLATQVSGLVTKAMQIQQAGDIDSIKEAEASSAIDDKISTVDDGLHASTTAIMTAHNSFQNSTSPEIFYAGMYGEGLFNFEQYYAIDAEIERRKQIVSG